MDNDDLFWAINHIWGTPDKIPNVPRNLSHIPKNLSLMSTLRGTTKASYSQFFKLWCQAALKSSQTIPNRKKPLEEMTDDEFKVFITAMIDRLERSRSLLIKITLTIGSPEALQANVDMSIISLLANQGNTDVMQETIKRSHLMQMVIQMVMDTERAYRARNLDMILEHS